MYSILVIDDEKAVRDAFVLSLDEEHYRVRTAASGSEGIEAARQERPDLVFLDLKMPDMDGVETLRHLLADDPSLQVYIVTAFYKEFMEPLRLAREEGLPFQLAIKPLSPDRIVQITETILG